MEKKHAKFCTQCGAHIILLDNPSDASMPLGQPGTDDINILGV